MSLVCPYCQGMFEPEEILFYTDATDSDFFKVVGGERDVTQTGSVILDDHYSYGSSLASKVARRGFRTYSAAENLPEENKTQTETKENDNRFLLGESVEDTVATKFMRKYGEGSLFRFQRTAVFYGIKSREEISPDNKQYGYVDEWESGSGHSVPLVLFVPTRPSGRERLTERVCPHCHCNIPKDYFTVPEDHRHIAALGGCTSAGKTQFITVALRDLVRETFQNLHLGRIEWTPCSRWFHDLYAKQYENNNGSMDGTKKEFALFPLMLRVITEDKEIYFISFQDCAGEYANNHEFASNQSGFRNASVLLLMIDSVQLFRDLDEKLEEHGELPCKVRYEDATYPLREYRLCPNVKRCITVITKSDILIHEGYIHGQTVSGWNDSMTCYSHNMNCHRNTVDLATIQRINTELCNMLTENGEPELPKHIADDLNLREEDINLLAVSTYFWKGNELVNAPEKLTGHHRITEPILLAMYEWGILKGEEKEAIIEQSAQIAEPQPAEKPKKRRFFGR